MAELWGQFVIPTGLYSDRSIFRQVYIPTGRYSDRSIFRQVYIPTGRYSDRSLFVICLKNKNICKVISSIYIRHDNGLNDANHQHNRLYQALITTYP